MRLCVLLSCCLAEPIIYTEHKTTPRKTVIGEMALHWATSSLQNKKGIYTTPLKALSNEKYRDFCAIYGRHTVGLSTGDVSINQGAKISIMTTEVYRNIAWRASLPNEGDELTDTAMVILDELHYMGQPGRGGVWEESIVTSPSAHLQIIGLSATLANGHDLCAWMEHVTQRPTVLVQVPDFKRPVPLRYVFATRDGLFPLFRDPDAGPGAPHGLLGLRGQGDDVFSTTTNQPSKRSKNKGFAPIVVTEKQSAPPLPIGLQVNPVLLRLSENRLAKVNRALDKQLQSRRSTVVRSNGAGNDDDNNKQFSPRRKIRSFGPPAKISQREARRERDRLLKKEMRRSVPTLHALLERLRRQELLPAICFIFSRAGCDNAARNVAVSMMSSAGMDRQLVLLQEVGDKDDYSNNSNDDDDANGAAVKRKKKKRQRSTKRQKKMQDKILEDQNGRSFRGDGNFVSEDLLFETMMMNDVTDDLTSMVLMSQNDDENAGSVLSPDKYPFYSGAGLLDVQQVQKVASAIITFNQRNEELAFDDEVIEQFLLGLGSHVRICFAFCSFLFCFLHFDSNIGYASSAHSTLACCPPTSPLWKYCTNGNS
jgi:DEAD/DEAH box helicase